jgi:hypothetical protein
MVAMGLTYTHGRDRATIRARRRSIQISEWILGLTSVVMLLTVAIACAGRMRAEAVRAAGEPAPLNLNSETDATPDKLEGPLATVFSDPRERKAAAMALGTRRAIGRTSAPSPASPSPAARCSHRRNSRR